MKKAILFLLFVLLSSSILVPFLAKSQSLYRSDSIIQCGNGDPIITQGPDKGKPNPAFKACQLSDFFKMLFSLYGLVVKYFVTTISIIAITIGGLLMIVSPANPNLYATGRKTVTWAIIGLVLVFGSYLIINVILNLLGYNMGDWSNLSF